MGYALWSVKRECFVKAGCLLTEKQKGVLVAKDNIRCIKELVCRLATIMERYQPVKVIGEFPHGGAQNAKAATAMALATALVVTLAKLRGVPLVTVTPNEIKRQVDPEKGTAVEKKEIIAYAAARFGEHLLPRNANREHVADAMTTIDVYRLRKE